MASQGRFTVAERMESAHGSIGKALRTLIEEGLTTADISRVYGCSDNFIGRILKSTGIVNTNKGRIKRAIDVDPCMGDTGAESRKADTAAMERGFAKSREVLSATVITYKPGDPEFPQVAADVMRQRETCHRKAYTQKLWRE